MKLSIPTSELKNVTRTLSRVASRGISGSSQVFIHIEVSSGVTSFRTDQFDFNVKYTMKTENSVDGSVSVPIHILDGVVETLVDNITTISLENKQLTVQTPSSTSDVYIADETEKDSEEETGTDIKKPDAKSFTIRREILVQGFKNVHHAAAESVIKPEIASVYIYTKNNSIYFVSTDSFRLAEMRFPLDNSPEDDISLLIPEKNIVKILRVLEGVSDVDISLCTNDNAIYLFTESFIIKTNGIRGDFPNYKNIIPESFELTITLLRSDLQNFLKKARIFANKLNKLSFTAQGEKSLIMEFGNETVGVTKNTIPAVIQGSVDTIPSFNYKFVYDVLSVIQDDRVVFSIPDDTKKPIMIRGVNSSNLTTIIAPLLER